MSHDPKISHAPASIDGLLRQANTDALKNGVDERTLALALEANQRMIEYADELIESLQEETPNPQSTSVLLKTNGKGIKFKNIDDAANFIAGWKEW
jgi:hypothetical protein